MMIWYVYVIPEPTSAQIQEAIGEAVNNIVKHFHKPEKEVSDSSHLITGVLSLITEQCGLYPLWLYPAPHWLS